MTGLKMAPEASTTAKSNTSAKISHAVIDLGEDAAPLQQLLSACGKRSYVFPEPQNLLTSSPKLPGTDGRKMSKSYNNTIQLSEPPRAFAPS